MEYEQQSTIVNSTPEQHTEFVENSDIKYFELMNGAAYKNLLVKFGSNNVSITNLLYLLSQNPNATIVRNMQEWNRVGRSIKPEEKSLIIMSPIKSNDHQEDGNKNSRKRTTDFHPAYVFDISSTEGENFNPYKIGADLSDRERNVYLDAVHLALTKGRYKHKFVDSEKLPKGVNCTIDPDTKTISVRKGMKNYETVLTLLDASARALLSNSKTRLHYDGLLDEEAANVEADSIDCILAARYGLDCSGYDFSCIDSWDDNRKCAFRDNLNIICSSTKTVMDKVDYSFYRGNQSAVGVDAILAPRNAFWNFGKSHEAVAE